MPSNTPSSLKWLIDKQVRLAGQIDRKCEQLATHLKEVAACKQEIQALQRKLVSIERAMRLHDIRIDPLELRPIRPHTRKIVAYGQMTRTIRRALSHTPNQTASTTELLTALLKEFGASPTEGELAFIHQQLRVRLCSMARDGRLIRHPCADRSVPRVWQLPEWYQAEP
jgi:hypothetical protein